MEERSSTSHDLHQLRLLSSGDISASRFPQTDTTESETLGDKESDFRHERRDERSSDEIRADKPFVLMSARHSAITILVLICAVCASLTLLVIQGKNIAAMSSVSEDTSIEQSTAEKEETESEKESKNKATDLYAAEQENSENQKPAESSTVPAPSHYQPETQPNTSSSNSASRNLIDINSADSQQLQTIIGIGPAIAQKILDYRASNGNFASVDDLVNVSGIGPKTLEKMKPYVCVR